MDDYESVTLDLDRMVHPFRDDVSVTAGTDLSEPGHPAESSSSAVFCRQWHGFRDPDELTFGRYVMLQGAADTLVIGVLRHFETAAHDSSLDPEWVDTLGVLFTPLRYPLYGLQQVESYLGIVAPTPKVVNAAAFAAADFVRATSVVALRTRRLRGRPPSRSTVGRDRYMWQEAAAWQPARRAVEAAMATSGFGEVLTAVNLVLWPALESVLFRSFGQVAHANGDALTWLLLASLANDAERNRRWSMEVAGHAVRERPANEAVFRRIADRWVPRAREAVEPLAAAIAELPRAMAASDVTEAAAQAVAESLASTRAAG